MFLRWSPTKHYQGHSLNYVEASALRLEQGQRPRYRKRQPERMLSAREGAALGRGDNLSQPVPWEKGKAALRRGDRPGVAPRDPGLPAGPEVSVPENTEQSSEELGWGGGDGASGSCLQCSSDVTADGGPEQPEPGREAAGDTERKRKEEDIATIKGLPGHSGAQLRPK